MEMGKHTSTGLKIKELQETIKSLEETIKLKDKEIKDVKFSIADVLSEIRDLNESNDYGDPSLRKRVISEKCTNARYELLIDEINNEVEKGKIIELPTTVQSRK